MRGRPINLNTNSIYFCIGNNHRLHKAFILRRSSVEHAGTVVPCRVWADQQRFYDTAVGIANFTNLNFTRAYLPRLSRSTNSARPERLVGFIRRMLIAVK